LAFDSAAHLLDVDRGIVQSTYGRFHFEPRLKVPLSPASWLSLTLNGGGNLTWYGDSVDPSLAGSNTFTGDSLSRTLPFGAAEVIGPSFSRIIDRQVGPFARFKHIVEPRFDWSYYGAFEEQLQVPVFDEVDLLSPLGENVGRVALINRLLAKPADPAKGGAREILVLELSRAYSFDQQQLLEAGDGEESAWGPLRATLRAPITPGFDLRIAANYSVLFGQITGVQANGDFTVGRQRFGFTWTPTWRALDGQVVTNQGTFSAAISPSRKLKLSSYVTYDFERSLLRDQRHLLTWLGSCYQFHLELHESVFGNERRRDYLFSIDLKNVGTFIDLNGGETQGL
jgi:hypothetical protein